MKFTSYKINQVTTTGNSSSDKSTVYKFGNDEKNFFKLTSNTNGLIVRRLQLFNRGNEQVVVYIYRATDRNVDFPIVMKLGSQEYKILMQGYTYLSLGCQLFVASQSVQDGVDFYVSCIQLDGNTTLL